MSEGENTSEKSFVSDGVHSRHNEFQRLSALKDHESSECRDTGIKEMKHEEAVAAGESLLPKHIVHEVPTDSAIASGMQKMSEKERAGITKLMDIAYFIALKRRPFTDFNDHIELEKLHGVKLIILDAQVIWQQVLFFEIMIEIRSFSGIWHTIFLNFLQQWWTQDQF